ncbi:MAG TPA: tyrosine--tRNA ligase [Cyanobacteria bacterium UBA8530]|nr:tyrosine--tRNA ligase [Cyanobacteria bacterium UBA8530]
MSVETSLAAEQAANLLGGAEVLPQNGLTLKLAECMRPLRVKLGFDPTKPDLHLGHAVVLRALKRFQDAGHQVVVIIGDFTAMIGDPTGKEATRPPLSLEEVKVNAQTYLDQLGTILDLSRTEVRFNGEWLSKLGLTEVIKLAARTTVAQMLARENFARRYERNEPIALHEFLYPLMQAYDSVAVEADVELGGTDQRFNLLMGREIQEAYGQAPQVVAMCPILEGTDGVHKMSKSLGNAISLTEDPKEMYGKTMSIPDSLLENYFTLASGLPLSEVARISEGLKSGAIHPRDAKMLLARSTVALYHGQEEAKRAEESFVRQFQQHQLPTEIEEYPVNAGIPISNLLVQIGLVKSTSEARRVIDQGGVKLHKNSGEMETLRDPLGILEIPSEGLTIQVGKRKFGKLISPGAKTKTIEKQT